MTTRIKHYFTFGIDHVSSYPDIKGPLADHWVTVDLPEGHEVTHREMFIDHFTSFYCPRPAQWGFEYEEIKLIKEFFPLGELCVITEEGLQHDD